MDDFGAAGGGDEGWFDSKHKESQMGAAWIAMIENLDETTRLQVALGAATLLWASVCLWRFVTQRRVPPIVAVAPLALHPIVALVVFHHSMDALETIDDVAEARRETEAMLPSFTVETLKELKNLKEPLTITAYFSANPPESLAANARSLTRLLNAYQFVAGDHLRVSYIDPDGDEAREQRKKAPRKRDRYGGSGRERTVIERDLEDFKIQRVRGAYLGIGLRSGGRIQSIPAIVDISSIDFDLTTSIRRLTSERQPVLGVIGGHGENADWAQMQLDSSPDDPLQNIKMALGQRYDVQRASSEGDADDFAEAGMGKPPGLSQSLEHVDAALVIGPTKAYSEDELKALDTFIMKGKGVGFFLDRNQIDLNTIVPTPITHNVDKLTEKYGLVLGTQVVGDVDCLSLGVNEQRGQRIVQRTVPYPYGPVLTRLEDNPALTRGLAGIVMPFVVPVSAKKVDGVETTVLARSSAKSWLDDSTAEHLSPLRDWNPETFTMTGPYDLVVTARGTLPSYANASKKSEPGARLFVVGSSQLMNEQVLGPANAALFMNLVDWLFLDGRLLAIPNRGSDEIAAFPDPADPARKATRRFRAHAEALRVFAGLFAAIPGAAVLLLGAALGGRRRPRRSAAIAPTLLLLSPLVLAPLVAGTLGAAVEDSAARFAGFAAVAIFVAIVVAEEEDAAWRYERTVTAVIAAGCVVAAVELAATAASSVDGLRALTLADPADRARAVLRVLRELRPAPVRVVEIGFLCLVGGLLVSRDSARVGMPRMVGAALGVFALLLWGAVLPVVDERVRIEAGNIQLDGFLDRAPSQQ